MSQPQGGDPGQPAGQGGAPGTGHPAGYPPPYAQGHNQPGYPGYQGYEGYPGHPGYRNYPPRRPSLLSRLQPTAAASIAVLVCALICYFAGYANEGARFYIAIYVLLAGGLLCAVHAIRTGKATADGSASPNTIVPGAVLSMVGGLGVLFQVIHLPALPVSAVIILIFALLQLVVAAVALLLEAGLFVLPPLRRPAPQAWTPPRPPGGAGQPNPQWGAPPYSPPAAGSTGAHPTRPGMAWPQSEVAQAPESGERADPEQARGTAAPRPERGPGEAGGTENGPGPTAYLPTTPENAPHGHGTTPGGRSGS